MGLLTPVAVRLGKLSWMPRFLPQIAWLDDRLQRLTRGRVGFLELAGLPGLVLTVPGRRSGIPRSTNLLTVPYLGGWLVAGSSFGAPEPPAWAANLRAADTATVRYRGKDVTVRWEELAGDERASAWAAMVEVWPNFDHYAARTDRVIPVFHLTRA
ncbi:nitroreductase/quinone reductase family protein [Nocardioides sp. TF02-7]|uniref:nitroreductase/quinone reductase family protein n=1 Tax=Nocardioides sp. TF02-7 TaxID=2917724 RepID=UPI001F07099C|nr:nitroreductase/quinone reductase family protein [Nocardioides sp. TF02-7]UMG93808.1 nitroreductase/quinone reductase family protein [Nocardioides sp. TF02-7]